jgi:hypothetical protein
LLASSNVPTFFWSSEFRAIDNNHHEHMKPVELCIVRGAARAAEVVDLLVATDIDAHGEIGVLPAPLGDLVAVDIWSRRRNRSPVGLHDSCANQTDRADEHAFDSAMAGFIADRVSHVHS